ncbi:MAG: hypothetical protein II620_03170, partial [Paludibacteraceae bacterium]|nr:hypothetical protein [Paludibacteraceae bacterium]
MGKTEGDRKITIKVTKHQIPLHIKPEDEELYREAETALRLRLYELGKTIKRDEDFMLAAIAYELMLEKPDVIVVDPPRAGIQPKALDKIIS